MKKSSTYFLLFVLQTIFTGNAYSQKESVKSSEKYPSPAFQKITNWNTTVQKAKSENKLIFVDCYTDWCGWCKVMDKKNFADTLVLKTMKSNMNCYSLEMEKDSVGMLLRYQYGVNVFPTFLIFNSQGFLLSKQMGYMEKTEWLQYLDSIGKMAIATNGNGIFKRPGFPPMDAKNVPEWYRKFVFNKDFNIYEDSTESGFKAQLSKITDPFQQFAVSGLGYYHFNDALTQRWLDNLPIYDSLFGKDLTNPITLNLLSIQISKATNSHNWALFNEKLTLLMKYSDNPEAMKSSQLIEWYEKQGDWNKALDIFEVSSYVKYPESLNSFAWSIYESSNDKQVLERALKLATTCVSLKEEYAYLDTKAALEYKLGKLAEAKADAERAILLGKQAGNDVDSTQKLLKQINSKKK